MSIYTGTGDRGETSLLGGARVSKADLVIEAYGTVDELNSVLGLARAFAQNPQVIAELEDIQKKLFWVAGELAAGPGGLEKLSQQISVGEVRHLELLIDQLQVQYSTPQDFVIPGGTPAIGTLDQARTVARRAERLVVRLSQGQVVRHELITYLNRVSDLLWVLARVEAREGLVKTIKGKVLEQLNGLPALTLGQAQSLLAAARRRAREIAVPMVVAIIDGGGNLVALERHDGALLVSIELAQGKAYTAAAMKMATHEVAKLAQPGEPLYGIEATNRGRVVVFGGGFPLVVGEQIVGGLGVSGGSVDEDLDVARAALAAWEQQ